MGKSNRIRVNRANNKMNSLNVKKKGNGMPGWAMSLITVVMAAALLLGVCAILIPTTGIFGRMTESMSSANFKVSQNMLRYYFNTEYQNFVSSNESYLSTSSTAGMYSLNASLPLKDQKFGGDGTKENYDTMLLGTIEGETWYDYFLENTVKSVKGMLVYCEYAKAHNINIDDEDKEEIKTNLEMYETYASLYGYPSANAFIAAQFGEGISKGDVEACLELSILANKARTEIAEKLEGQVKDTDINDRYAKDSKKYDNVDYAYYTFSVYYDDIIEDVLGKSDASDAEIENNKAKILEAYTKAIAEARADAEVLKASKDLDAFKLYIYNRVAKETAESSYAGQSIKNEIKPTVDGVTDLKAYFTEKIAAEVVKEILEGKETVTDAVKIETTDAKESDTDKSKATETDSTKKEEKTYEVYGATVKESFAKILNTVKSKTFDSVLSAKTRYVTEGASYISDENKVSVWAFGKDAKEGDVYVLNSYDGADKDGKAVAADKITEKNGQSQITVYRLVKPQYKNVQKTKNFSYMVFSKEDDANAALKALGELKTLNETEFKKYGDKQIEEGKATAVDSVTDYEKGNFGSTELDTWLFADTTKKNTLATKAYKVDSAYVVALFNGDGNEMWYLGVKEAIFTELAEAEAEKLEKDYPVTEREKTYAKINVVGQK